ncbi:MAG TPA: hypothetical protein VMV10_01730 [Pirellulales bacterium]|nr:hypothetical protein [Pirellulales bacterium]
MAEPKLENRKLALEMERYDLLRDLLKHVVNTTRGNVDYAQRIGFRVLGKDKREREANVSDQIDDLQRRIDELFIVAAVAAFEDAFMDKFKNASGKGKSILQDRLARESVPFNKHGGRLVKGQPDADSFKKIAEIISGIVPSADDKLDELRNCRNAIVHVNAERKETSSLAVTDSFRLLDEVLAALS